MVEAFSGQGADEDAAVSVGLASGLARLTGRVLLRRRPAAADLPAYQALTHKPTSPSFPSAHAAVARRLRRR